MRYAVIENGVVANVIIADGDFVGEDIKYVASDEAGIGWVFDGNNLTPPEMSPPSVPEPMLIASPWQIRKALNHFGIRDQVEAYIANADQDTKDAWEWATEFREDDPHVAAAVVALAPEINMTETDAEAFKHQIFALAVTL